MSSRVRAAYRTGRSGRVSDRHLHMRRIDDRFGRIPAIHTVGAPIRYELVNTSKTYRPNGSRECIRRMTQIAAGSLTESNGLVR